MLKLSFRGGEDRQRCVVEPHDAQLWPRSWYSFKHLLRGLEAAVNTQISSRSHTYTLFPSFLGASW